MSDTAEHLVKAENDPWLRHKESHVHCVLPSSLRGHRHIKGIGDLDKLQDATLHWTSSPSHPAAISKWRKGWRRITETVILFFSLFTDTSTHVYCHWSATMIWSSSSLDWLGFYLVACGQLLSHKRPITTPTKVPLTQTLWASADPWANHEGIKTTMNTLLQAWI